MSRPTKPKSRKAVRTNLSRSKRTLKRSEALIIALDTTLAGLFQRLVDTEWEKRFGPDYLCAKCSEAVNLETAGQQPPNSKAPDPKGRLNPKPVERSPATDETQPGPSSHKETLAPEDDQSGHGMIDS